MRPLGGNKVLGLAIGERSVLACELSRAGGRTVASHLAEFEFPPGVNPDDPPQLGRALAAFLRERGFSARRAMIGLPLKWAVVKPKEVPPASESAVAGLLLLQAEREFALEPQDLVFEYSGATDPSSPRTVLLLAVQRRRVEAVTAMAEAAGLSVRAVTLSAVALASETGRQLAHGGAVLHVTPGAAELAIHHDGQARVLRHLRTPQPGAVAGGGAAPPSDVATGATTRYFEGPSALTPELRQVLSLMPQNGTAAPTELVVWDGVGLGDAPQRWGEALGVAVREQDIDSLGVTSAPALNGAGSGRYATAVALGLEGLRGEAPRTDLLHSRLVPRKEPRVGRWTVWAVVLGLTAVLGVAAAVYDLSRQRSELAQMKAVATKYQPEIKVAEESILRVTFAQRWTSTDPKALGLMRDLTAAFPDGVGAWATSLSVQPDGRATLIGRAANDAAWGAVLKSLREGGRFTEVQLGGTQPAGRGSNEINFTITFKYVGLN